MIETLILWQLGSARAAEKSRIKAETDQGEGLIVMYMMFCFLLTTFIWPVTFGLRTTYFFKDFPVAAWFIVPTSALIGFLLLPTLYVAIGLLWATAELMYFLHRED